MPPSHNPEAEAVIIKQLFPKVTPAALRVFSKLRADGYYITRITRIAHRIWRIEGRLSTRNGGLVTPHFNRTFTI